MQGKIFFFFSAIPQARLKQLYRNKQYNLELFCQSVRRPILNFRCQLSIKGFFLHFLNSYYTIIHFRPFLFSIREGSYEYSASFHFTQQENKDLRSGLVLQTESLMQKINMELETTNSNLGWATPCCLGNPSKQSE